MLIYSLQIVEIIMYIFNPFNGNTMYVNVHFQLEIRTHFISTVSTLGENMFLWRWSNTNDCI